MPQNKMIKHIDLIVKLTMLVSILLFLPACHGGEQGKDLFALPEIETEISFPVGADCESIPISGDLYGDRFYYADADTMTPHCIDLLSGSDTVFPCEGESVSLVSADESGVYLLDGGTLIHADPVGTVLESWETPPLSGNEHYIDMDSGDGILVLLSQSSGFILNTRKGTYKEMDFAAAMFHDVQSVQVQDRTRIHIFAIPAGEQEKTADYLYNEKGKNIGYSQEIEASACWNLGALYSIGPSNGAVYRTEGNPPEKVFAEKVSKVSPDATSVRRLYVGEKTIAVWWMWERTLMLYPREEHEGVPVLLVPESKAEYVRQVCLPKLDEEKFLVQSFPDSVFAEKLTTALLAGDSDFDVVNISGIAEEDVMTLYTALLRNGVWVDLYSDPELKANLEKLYPGILSMAEYGGKLPILPTDFSIPLYSFTADAGETADGFPESPDIEDFCALCDSLAGTGKALYGNQFALYPAVKLLSLVTLTAEQDIDPVTGAVLTEAKKDLEEILLLLERYRDEGVLFGEVPVLEEPFRSTIKFNHVLESEDPEQIRYIFPWKVTEDSGFDVVLTGFYFINPKSERMDEAFEYLTRLTDDQNIYDTSLFGAPLRPGMEKYGSDPAGSDQPFRDVPSDFIPAYEKLETCLDGYYRSAQFQAFPNNAGLVQVMADFLTGSTDAAACAAAVYEEYIYHVKG